MYVFPLIFVLLVRFYVAAACKCSQLSEEVRRIDDELVNLREDVHVLSRKVSVNVGLRHAVDRLEMSSILMADQMSELTAEVRELRRRDQNAVSNLIQVVPGSTMEDLVNKVLEDEARVKRLAAQVAEIKDERVLLITSISKMKEENSSANNRTKMSLLDTLEDVRSDLAEFREKLDGVSSVAQRLDALESRVSVDDSILAELGPPRLEYASDDAANVTQIEFIGADGNFTVNIDDAGDFGCRGYVNVTGGSRPQGCAEYLNESGVQNETGARSVRTVRGGNLTPLNRVLHVLAGKVKDVHENVSRLNLTRRLGSLEDAAQQVERRLAEQQDGVLSDIEEVQGSVRELEFQVRNLTDEVSILRQPSVANGTDGDMELLQQLQANGSEVRSLLNYALSKLQTIEQSMENLTTEGNGTLVTLQALNGSLGEISKHVTLLNTSVEDRLKQRLSGGDAQTLRYVMDSEIVTLNKTVSSSLHLMNRTIEENIEVLKERMNALQDALAEEEEKMKTMWLNISQASRTGLGSQGWHPDDITPCPGLLFLGRDDNLVLTTEAGTFRSPKLSAESLPAGSVVHFRCAHAGMFRLDGAETIRCFAGRWSSRPPRCQSLTTLEELRANITTDNTPSITYEPADEAGYSTDEQGRLVFPPGASISLTCLYPRSKGQVRWLHNETLPKDATSAWLNGSDSNYAYKLSVPNASVAHSGVYACVGPDGEKHEVHVRVREVFCEELEAPPGGAMDVSHTGPMTMGTVVRFWCPLGHRLQGEAELSCSASGQWSAPVPSCPEIEDYSPPWNACSKPALPDTLSLSPEQKWYDDGDRIQYACRGGGMLIGKASSMCLQGRWIGNTPSCL